MKDNEPTPSDLKREAVVKQAKRYYQIHHDPQYSDIDIISDFAIEYAKQEAVEFAEYVERHGWTTGTEGRWYNTYDKGLIYYGTKDTITSSELYDLFKAHNP